AQSVAIAAAAVGGVQQVGDPWIQPSSFVTPPPADRGHRETGRIMVGAHIDKAGVLAQIVNAVRVGPRYRRIGKVMALDSFSSSLPTPLAPFVFEVSN